MKKSITTIIICISCQSALAAAPSNEKVNIRLVNSSDQTVCILGQDVKQCTGRGDEIFSLDAQNFYKRTGVIRISIGNSPAKIGMFNKNQTTANLYVDPKGILHSNRAAFEPQSFQYSDDLDYLYYVVKPNYLFTQYPA